MRLISWTLQSGSEQSGLTSVGCMSESILAGVGYSGEPRLTGSKWDESGTRGERGASWVKNGALFVFCFRTYLSLMEHVKLLMVDIYLINHFV
jgi:hypothetical protein